MKQLAVLGWLGHRNLGDQLFMRAYRELFKGWDIKFFSDSPDASIPLIDFDEVNNCDLFALGGGELINRDRLFISGSWAPKIKIPKIMLGCGVNAEKYSQISQTTLCELYSYKFLGLRDYASTILLSQDCQCRDKIGLFYDLAFSIDTSTSKVKPQDERIAVVIPTDRTSNKSDRGIREHAIARKSRKWLRERTAPFDQVVFLAFGEEDNNDYQTCLMLADAIPQESTIISDCEKNADLMLAVIANATSVYAYRLHGLVLANLFRRPYTFYPYHWKLNRVEETLHGCTPEMIKAWQRMYLDKVLANIGLS